MRKTRNTAAIAQRRVTVPNQQTNRNCNFNARQFFFLSKMKKRNTERKNERKKQRKKG